MQNYVGLISVLLQNYFCRVTGIKSFSLLTQDGQPLLIDEMDAQPVIGQHCHQRTQSPDTLLVQIMFCYQYAI